MLAALGAGAGNQISDGKGVVPVDTSEAVPAAVESIREDIGPLPEGESTNVWPDEAAEAAFFAEARSQGEPAGRAGAETVRAPGEKDDEALPPVDKLVKRIPAEVREMLDDLFRAKFTGVKRVPAKHLKE